MAHADGIMPRDLVSVIERFRGIAETILGTEDVSVDPWLHTYCGATADPRGAARYVRQQADLLRPGWPTAGHPVIVDAGCGFGFTLIVATLLGAQAARGLELNPSMIASIRAYLPLLPDDLSSRIDVSQGNVNEMPYEDSSADIVLSIEAISHYLDVGRFLDEARRVLRPGGVLVISDSNNGSNPRVRRETYEVWNTVENGPAGANVRGLVIGAPYVEIRQALLGERFPDLPVGVRADIARRTAGFTEAQLIAAARDYLESGRLPNAYYRRRQLAVAPDGAAMERLFSPRRLARTLRQEGFDAAAYGYWGGAGGATWVRLANRVLAQLSPLTMPTAPSFRIVARKRGSQSTGWG